MFDPIAGDVRRLLDRRLDELARVAAKGAARAAQTIARSAEVGIETARNTRHSGPVYPGQPNPASLPGESPATQSDELYDSYRATASATEVTIASDDIKAPALEFGQDRNGRRHIKPRPMLRPLVATLRPIIRQEVMREISALQGRIR